MYFFVLETQIYPPSPNVKISDFQVPVFLSPFFSFLFVQAFVKCCNTDCRLCCSMQFIIILLKILVLQQHDKCIGHTCVLVLFLFCAHFITVKNVLHSASVNCCRFCERSIGLHFSLSKSMTCKGLNPCFLKNI